MLLMGDRSHTKNHPIVGDFLYVNIFYNNIDNIIYIYYDVLYYEKREEIS